jgi:hypothetical protein
MTTGMKPNEVTSAPEELTPEQRLAQMAMELLTRTEIRGREADGYARCFNFLRQIASAELLVVAADHWSAISQELDRAKANELEAVD